MSVAYVKLITSQIGQLYDSPALIMSPPGVGLAYFVHQVAFAYFKGTLQALNPPKGSILALEYGSASRAEGPWAAKTNCIPFLNQTANVFTGPVGCQDVYQDQDNKGLYLSNTVGNIDTTNSDATLVLTIWYDTIGAV